MAAASNKVVINVEEHLPCLANTLQMFVCKFYTQ